MFPNIEAQNLVHAFSAKTARHLKKTQISLPFHEPLSLSGDEQSKSRHPDLNLCKSNTQQAGWGTIAPETHRALARKKKEKKKKKGGKKANYSFRKVHQTLFSSMLRNGKHIHAAVGKPRKFS